MVEVYTDGSCINGCIGGWGFIMITNNIEYHVSGRNENTTNNRMELQAVIEALVFKKEINKYKIYTDSKLILHCAKRDWKRNANLDLWKLYDIVSEGKEIEWEWVKAHNGNYYNDLVDNLARKTAKNL